jgi:hypothetical protein
VPEAGTRFEVVEHERQARDRAQQAEEKLRRQELAQGGSRRSLEDLLGQGGMQDLNLVIKADVAGSVEALKEALAKLSTDEVRVNIVRSGVGALTDSDVMLGSASDGILLGFNVRPTNTAKQVAEREGVEIRTYDVIYKALEEIEAAMRGMLAPEEREQETGTAEVRQTFRTPNAGVVAGCMVTSGEIFRNNRVRLVRDGTVVYEGNIGSLKRFRDDARSSARASSAASASRTSTTSRRATSWSSSRSSRSRGNSGLFAVRGEAGAGPSLRLQPQGQAPDDTLPARPAAEKNVSVVESDHQDLWQRATVEIALAAVSRGAAEEKREELRRTLLNYEELSIVEWREEFVKI